MHFSNSPTFLIVPYVVFSIFVGFLGRHKKIGNLNATFILFFISLTLTPLIGLIFLTQAKAHDPFEEEIKELKSMYKCEFCGWKFDNPFEYCPHCNKKATGNRQ